MSYGGPLDEGEGMSQGDAQVDNAWMSFARMHDKLWAPNKHMQKQHSEHLLIVWVLFIKQVSS